MGAVEEVFECEIMDSHCISSRVEPSTSASVESLKPYQGGIESWVEAIKHRGSIPIESLKPYQEGL